MSQQATPTYDEIMTTIDRIAKQQEETDKQMKETAKQQEETDKQMKETAKQMKETDRKISALGSRIGEIIENMVGGDNIINQFQRLGYNDLDDYCRDKKFKNKKLGLSGQIDLFIENGDLAILVEVKTTLETADVRKHIEQMEKFRRCVDAKGVDKRQFIGAVAGAVIKGDAVEFALENGLYVIVQSGDAFVILSPPKGFTAKKW